MFVVILFSCVVWLICELCLSCVFICLTLTHIGFTSEALHGDKSQPERDRTMNKFREGRIRILVATDVAARGLDVKDI